MPNNTKPVYGIRDNKTLTEVMPNIWAEDVRTKEAGTSDSVRTIKINGVPIGRKAYITSVNRLVIDSGGHIILSDIVKTDGTDPRGVKYVKLVEDERSGGQLNVEIRFDGTKQPSEGEREWYRIHLQPFNF